MNRLNTAPVDALTTLQSLAQTAPNTILEIIVRCIKEKIDNPPDIKNFSDAVEYRKSLIQFQKLSTEKPKKFLIEAANNLGLQIRSADTVNALFVRGNALTLLSFVENNPIESFLFNQSLT